MSMKFIHTSDWHLGQVFNEYDRDEEHREFFRLLAGYVSEYRPDALLVSGDIFHNSIPSMQAMRLYNEAVLMMKEACPDMEVIITAGNHDSGSRLEIDRALWSHFGVTVTGGIARKDGAPDLDRHIIRVPSREGGTAGYVVALPYICQPCYPAFRTDDAGAPCASSADRQKQLYSKLLERVGKMNKERLPVVMMAHLAVSGCDITGHDEPVGGMEYTSLDTFGSGYDYLALGHIHHPQFVGASFTVTEDGEAVSDGPVARYSGSPVSVSFDEDYQHSVSLVDITQGRITVKELPVPQTIRMVTLPEKPLPFDEALACLAAFPDHRRAYIRLNVQVKDFLPANAAVQVQNAVEGKKCRYCHIRTVRGQVQGYDGTAALSTEEFRRLSPSEIAERYYRRVFSSEMDGDMKQMLAELERELARTEE